MRRLVFYIITLMIFTSVFINGQDKYLTTGDIQMRYQVSGDGDAVILLHGWGNSLESWHFLFPELAANYKTVRYDRRGFGKSGGSPDVSLDPVDLCLLMDSLKIEKAVIIGHSQGGGSALGFALAYPDRLTGLVLFGAAAPAGFGLPWNGPDAFPSNMVQIAREHGLDSMKTMFAGHPVGKGIVLGTEGADIMIAMFGAYDGRDILNSKPTANATPAPDIKRLGEVKVPALVITGEMEMPYFKIVSDALAYGIPNAVRAVIPGGGHSVHLQQPALFNAEIKKFLGSILK